MSAPTLLGSQPMRVVSHIDDAIQHTTQMMFRPFNFSKWLLLGVTIFLASLGSGGAGFGYKGFSNFNNPNSPFKFSKIVQTYDNVNAWLSSHFLFLLLIALPVMLVLLAITFLLLWLRSRGEMMFIRAVSLNDERIGEN